MTESKSPEGAPPARADLTAEVCPMTFVRAKLFLEELPPGAVAELLLADGEAIRDVPRSLKDEGHQVIGVRREGESFLLLVRKRGTPGERT